MKKVAAKMMILLLLAFFASGSITHAAGPASNNISAVVKEIDGAKSEILVQAYSLSSKDIANALVDAHKRGVRTQIVLDKSAISLGTSIADYTHNMGIPTYIDSEHDIAENKIIVVDKETVITDSFNFARAAGEKGAQNLLILRSHELAQMYIDDWNKHRKHSAAYAGKQ